MKNKIFSILCIFLLVITSLFTNVKAIEITSDDLTFNIPNGVYNYLLGNYENGGYLLLVPKSENAVFKITGETNKAYGIMCYFDTSFTTVCPFDSYYLPFGNGTDFNSSSVSITKDVTTNRTFEKNKPFFYSSFDVYNASGKIFFQKPLLGITKTLVVETEKAQIAEQIKIMIAGFLKYLIALVISVIAFWKGWQFLSIQLRKN